MVRVVLSNPMLAVTGTAKELDVVAANFRQLTLALIEQWPPLAELIDSSAVAIDGQIYQDAFAEPLQEQSEVFFMPRIEGG
ncbi:MAG: MoaD/ThiS family protein [Proteobacteria bacterium]|nr:MoaD/ThiS family protein [Pseudomonadota bacterium]